MKKRMMAVSQKGPIVMPVGQLAQIPDSQDLNHIPVSKDSTSLLILSYELKSHVYDMVFFC
jgi:hypothetical protein